MQSIYDPETKSIFINNDITGGQIENFFEELNNSGNFIFKLLVEKLTILNSFIQRNESFFDNPHLKEIAVKNSIIRSDIVLNNISNCNIIFDDVIVNDFYIDGCKNVNFTFINCNFIRYVEFGECKNIHFNFFSSGIDYKCNKNGTTLCFYNTEVTFNVDKSSFIETLNYKNKNIPWMRLNFNVKCLEWGDNFILIEENWSIEKAIELGFTIDDLDKIEECYVLNRVNNVNYNLIREELIELKTKNMRLNC